MRDYTPSQAEINAMFDELSTNGYESYLRHMKEQTNLKMDDIVRMIVKATGQTAIDIRKWKKDGVANKACAKALCELAQRMGFYFGQHMLLPTKAVCKHWLVHDRHNFSGT
ncbi:hypothetical protein A1OO_08755 [Enterovibrio norvegicus FF-33]|uniref:hypothetical protein n=1 Tax=Enterovibrio norvegicus TaxID=188144 RepID=UPI00030D7B86|nr:hypothetical protein [Enterovibrio norvegicus]OEE65888.1 hypothetical protein A1OO_08755 [Enterovibrio norvegicus FF-33]